jgi:hypothetical protein
VQRREPVFFFRSLPPSLSRFFLSLTFPLNCFSFPSGPSPLLLFFSCFYRPETLCW